MFQVIRNCAIACVIAVSAIVTSTPPDAANVILGATNNAKGGN